MSEVLIKPQNEILDDILRTLEAGMFDAGKVIDISQGSDYYILAQALTNEINLANQNVVAAADNAMPDTANGDDLDRLLVVYGVEPRKLAQPARGYITIRSTQAVTIPKDATLVASNGTICKVLYGGVYSSGQEVELYTTTTGESANLVVGDKLTWSSPPAYINPVSLVSYAFVGGADAEDYESARARLYAKLQSPATDYNWAHVAKICEEADPIIQKAYVYPACNGPSTLHIALTRSAVESNKSRAITPQQLTNAVQTIQALMPEYVESYITTVTDYPVDYGFKINLPYPLGSTNTTSFGGGWVNPVPYPIASVGSGGYAYVDSVVNTKLFTIVSAANGQTPVNGLTQISWLNKTTWKLETAVIVRHTVTSPGVIEVETNLPFVGIIAGDFIMPAAINGQAYIDKILQEFNGLGPGEKTDVAGVLPRAYRKPRPNISNPEGLDAQTLKNLILAFPEIKTADFSYYNLSVPSVPSNITDAPNIFTPRNIAFYPYY